MYGTRDNVAMSFIPLVILFAPWLMIAYLSASCAPSKDARSQTTSMPRTDVVPLDTSSVSPAQCADTPEPERTFGVGCDVHFGVSRIRTVPLEFLREGWVAFTAVHGNVGYPIELFEKLYVAHSTHPEKAVRIHFPGALSLACHFDSDSEALEFVQLFTSADTHFIFEWPNAIDVIPGEMNSARPMAGTLRRAVYAKLGLSEPTVRAESSSYICSRYLVGRQATAAGYPIIRIVEQVAATGGYQLLSYQIIDYVPSSEVETQDIHTAF